MGTDRTGRAGREPLALGGAETPVWLSRFRPGRPGGRLRRDREVVEWQDRAFRSVVRPDDVRVGRSPPVVVDRLVEPVGVVDPREFVLGRLALPVDPEPIADEVGG